MVVHAAWGKSVVCNGIDVLLEARMIKIFCGIRNGPLGVNRASFSSVPSQAPNILGNSLFVGLEDLESGAVGSLRQVVQNGFSTSKSSSEFLLERNVS